MPDNSIFDKPGEWEVRTTIYRNGRRVATSDALGDYFDHAVDTVVTDLQRRDVEMHQIRKRPTDPTKESRSATD